MPHFTPPYSSFYPASFRRKQLPKLCMQAHQHMTPAPSTSCPHLDVMVQLCEDAAGNCWCADTAQVQLQLLLLLLMVIMTTS